MKSPLQKKAHAGRSHVLGHRGGVRALLAAMAIAMVVAASAGEVFMLPASHMLWRTAPSACFEVPVFLPAGASSATLVVTGNGYRREYEDIADGMFQLSLPAADSADAENVYDLELSFNNDAGTAYHAKLAVVQGAASGGAAEAFVKAEDSHKWPMVATKTALLPIPAGVDAISVNGQAVDASLWQSPGWLPFSAQVGASHDILLTGGSLTLAEAVLYGIPTGFKFILK